MKHLHACLSAKEVEKAVFIAVEAVLRLVQACLCAGNPDKSILTSEEVV